MLKFITDEASVHIKAGSYRLVLKLLSSFYQMFGTSAPLNSSGKIFKLAIESSLINDFSRMLVLLIIRLLRLLKLKSRRVIVVKFKKRKVPKMMSKRRHELCRILFNFFLCLQNIFARRLPYVFIFITTHYFCIEFYFLIFIFFPNQQDKNLEKSKDDFYFCVKLENVILRLICEFCENF